MDVTKFVRGVNHVESEHPMVCLEEETIMGVDEAGRGPVLGPMVYGTVFYPVSKEDDFESFKFRDSKILNVERREELFQVIKDNHSWIGWKVAIISPDYISNCMLERAKYSLNEVSHDSCIELIKKVLSGGVKLSQVYVDTVGDPRKYQTKLQNIFPNLKITVSVKADSLFSVVSAASICAKVNRDYCLNNWQYIEEPTQIYSRQSGSGYPSDPATKAWLTDNADPVFGYPCIVRFSWATCDAKLNSRAYEVKWENSEPSGPTLGIGNSKINQFFQSKSYNKKPRKRHRYFTKRHLLTFDTF